MSHLKKKDLDRYKQILQEKRDTLIEKARRTRDERKAAVPEGGEDYVDDAVTSYTREFLLSLSDLDRRTLNMVMEALERIEDGTYGVCLLSGEEISIKRLDAVPWARYTVQAQESIERKEMAEAPLRDFAKDIESDEGEYEPEETETEAEVDDDEPVEDDEPVIDEAEVDVEVDVEVPDEEVPADEVLGSDDEEEDDEADVPAR